MLEMHICSKERTGSDRVYSSRAPVFSREKGFRGAVSLVQKLCLPFPPLSPACILV